MDTDDIINSYFKKRCDIFTDNVEENKNEYTDSDSDSDSDSDRKEKKDRDYSKIINELNSIYAKPISKKKNTNKNTEIVLGIDFGTTNSCCAIWRNGNMEVIMDEYGNRTVPSIVAFTNKSRYIGNDAKNQTELNPKNVVYEVKRLLGHKYSDKSIEDDTEFMTYDIDIDNTENENIVIKLGIGQSYSPEEIAAMILSRIKIMAENYLKQSVSKVVISVPANYNDAQRQATKDAAQIAGLDCIRIIHEPTAAALAYGLHSKMKNTNILVYDFGGGTLDVSLLNIENGLFEVLGGAGISHLGGADFDKKIMKHCLAQFKKTNNITSLSDLSTLSLQKLRRACENAKKILSTSTKTTIAIRNFYNECDLVVSLTQTKLVDICRDLLIIGLDPIHDILESHNMSSEEIDDIIMVGGMTRMPAIQNNIKNFMNKTPNCSVNPDEVVAMGAAIQGYLLVSDDDPFADSIRLLDILPLSLGVETIGGIMSTVIKKNTIIPYSKKRLYTTDSDYETSILIKIYEGERKMTKDNFFVGNFELAGIESLPRGGPEIEVQFSVDANGIITVYAEETETKIKNSITITGNKGRLTKMQIEKMVEDAKAYEIKDRIEQAKKQRYYEIDDLCSNITFNVNHSMFKLQEDDTNAINNEVVKIKGWLKQEDYNNREIEDYDEIIKQLKTKYSTLILKTNKVENDENMQNTNEDANATGIYEEDEEETEKHFEKIETEENGTTNMMEQDKAELKEIRNCLVELCYGLLDVITNKENKLDADDFIELRNSIDDTLLWVNVHMKTTKAEYKLKIDEINNKCENILSKYDNDLFEQNSKNKIDDLEKLCYLIKSALLRDVLLLDENDKKELEDKLDEAFDYLEAETKIESLCNDHIESINNLCNRLNQQKYMYVPINCPAKNNYDDEHGGISIEELKKMRK